MTLLTGSLGSLLPSTLLPGIFVSVSCLYGSGPSITANNSVNTSWCSPHSCIYIWEGWPRVLLVSWRVSPFCTPISKMEIFLWIWSPTYRMLSAVLVLLFLNGAEYFLMLFFFFWPKCTVYKILVPWPEIKPGSTAVKVPSPNHWTAREVTVSFILTCIPNHLTAVNWPMQFALMWKTIHEWPCFLLGYLLLGHRWLLGYFVCVCM